MERKVYLSGIKPTGKLHLGNYIGSIKPILNILQNEENIDVYFFLADYHALTTITDPIILKENIKDMMISLNSIFKSIKIHKSNKLYLYRQSKIGSIFELNWILNCFTAKGLLNRNHSYKQFIQNNIDKNKDPDKGMFMGIYNYPILMAADILISNANYVPVGKDQLQHIEICNDIVNKINHVYNNKVFNNIIPIILNNNLLPGIDGRKMSKSYNNIVDIFATEKQLQKYIYKFKTNFKENSEPKYPSESDIFLVYELFSTIKEYKQFSKKMMYEGLGWKEAKDIVFEKVKNELSLFEYDEENYKDIFNKGEYSVNNFFQQNIIKIKMNIGI